MTSLFGSFGVAFRNPLAVATAKPITRAYRIEGKVTWADDGTPVDGLTLGLGGTEARTDDQGKFRIVVEKK